MIICVEWVGLLAIIVNEELLMRLVVVSVVWTISDIMWSWLVIVVGILLVVIVVVMFDEGF